ncbi:signal peptidase II [Nocardia yamanashiensis]|uniref:signal peptidase II n=1 Tax=Nocardia yamanashiensis TaxID=209247 RepID=UPI001E58CCB7|nr:signal peptidase II [Nocardia yamanashiensis]UGT45981.1 signal peptidase II [Nocardia yamanashiensis]
MTAATARPGDNGGKAAADTDGEKAGAATTAAADGAGAASAAAAADGESAESAAAEDQRAAGRKRLPLLLTLAAVLLGLDLLTKTIVVAQLKPGQPIYLIGDWLRLSLVRNPGAAFSMATGMTWLLTLIAAAVVIGVIRIGRTLRSVPWAIGLGMVLGGALGNLIDRLFRAPGPLQGHVVDFVAVGWWPVFNVADSAIVCGAILLVALTVFGFEPDGTRAGRKEEDEIAEEKTV